MPFTNKLEDDKCTLFNVWLHQTPENKRRALSEDFRPLLNYYRFEPIDIEDESYQIYEVDEWSEEDEVAVSAGTHDVFMLPFNGLVCYDKEPFNACDDEVLVGLYPGSSFHFMLEDEVLDGDLQLEFEWSPASQGLSWDEYVKFHTDWHHFEAFQVYDWLSWRMRRGYPMSDEMTAHTWSYPGRGNRRRKDGCASDRSN